MQSNTPITDLRDERHPLESQNTQLAAALTALGIPLDQHIGAQHFTEKTERGVRNLTVWTLAERSADGRFIAADLVKVWNDDAWLKANRAHPLAAMRAAFRTYKALQNPDCTLRELITLDVAADRARDPELRPVSDEEILRQWAPFSASGEPPRTAVEYVIQAFRNHKLLIAFICDKQGPLVVKRRGDRQAIISRHTTPERRAKLLSELNS